MAPHWIAKTNRFWYRKASPKGVEFLLVDLSQTTTRPAFDQERLATALSKVPKRDYKPTELPFDTLEFSEDGKSIRFHIESTFWSCNIETYECKEPRELAVGPYEEASPSKEWIAYVKDFNLYVRYVPTGAIVQLTRDGESGWEYATEITSLRPMVAQETQNPKQRPAVFWSPDSSKLVTYRMDTRNAGRFTNLQFVPPDQLRPRAFSVVYPLPGEALPKAEPRFAAGTTSGQRIDPRPMRF